MANETVKNSCFYPADVVIQEQAKYVVFIKELQSQVRILEDFRSRVLQAFPHLDIGFFMAKLSAKRQQKSAQSSANRLNAKALPILPAFIDETKSSKNGTIKKGVVRAKTKKQRSVIRVRKFSDYERSDPGNEDSNVNEADLSNETNTSNSVRSKLDGSCVTHRTDSGFSTDGKPMRDEVSGGARNLEQTEMELDGRKIRNTCEEESDELMNVLEIIEKRSLTMRSMVEHQMMTNSTKEEELLTEIDQLQFEKELLAEKLLSVEMELKLHREEVVRLKDSLIESEVSKKIVEERLEAALAEREQLGSKINRIHSRFVTKHSPTIVESNISLSERIPTRGSSNGTKLKVRVDKSKVSAILQESRTLELKRQLLVLLVRSEVFRSRMESQDREWNLRLSSLKQLEIQWQKDMDSLKRVNNDLQVKIQKVSTELRMERTKRKVLERALHAAYKDLTTNSVHNKLSSECEDMITAVGEETAKNTPVNYVPNNYNRVAAGGSPIEERLGAAQWKWSYHLNTISVNSNGNHDVNS